MMVVATTVAHLGLVLAFLAALAAGRFNSAAGRP